MLTESDDPIQGIEGASLVNSNGKSVQDGLALPLSEGAALGLRVGKSEDALDTAIDKKDFKDALRLRLARIKASNEAPEQVDKKE